MNANGTKATVVRRVPNPVLQLGLTDPSAAPKRSGAVNPIHPNPTPEQDEATVRNSRGRRATTGATPRPMSDK